MIGHSELLRILLLSCCVSITVNADVSHSLDDYRMKRQVNSIPLVYPYGGTYKLLVGFSAPVHDINNINLAFAANFQYQYLQIQNISQLSQYYFIKTVSREQREADIETRKDERLEFYRAVANLLEMRGMNGYECVLRAICEAAQYPVEEEGLVGEIMHILLTTILALTRKIVAKHCCSQQSTVKNNGFILCVETPDYGRSSFEDKDLEWENSMSDFKDAATAGRQMFSCPAIYSGCPEGQGILELVTMLRDQ